MEKSSTFFPTRLGTKWSGSSLPSFVIYDRMLVIHTPHYN